MEKERIEEIKRTTSILCAQSKDTVLKIEEVIPFKLTLFFSDFYTKPAFKQQVLADVGKIMPTLKYTVELQCVDCGSLYKRTISKTSYIELLQSIHKENYNCHCQSCQSIIDKQKQTERGQSREKDRIWHEQRTQTFIETYLNPNRSWIEEVPLYERIRSCKSITPEAEEYAKKMPYKDFLQTPYWKAIASQVRKMHGFKCQLCGSNDTLNVHHPATYTFRGSEIWHLKELSCLCEKCHQKFHNKIED